MKPVQGQTKRPRKQNKSAETIYSCIFSGFMTDYTTVQWRMHDFFNEYLLGPYDNHVEKLIPETPTSSSLDGQDR